MERGENDVQAHVGRDRVSFGCIFDRNAYILGDVIGRCLYIAADTTSKMPFHKNF